MLILENSKLQRVCDVDMQFCDLRINCEDCPFYIDDCDGDPEKMEDYEY